ncbi:GTF2IRD2 [Cordylochernes scorpioides]|uniref:3',5'-cyclic-GMP phosphodiesterase n=1 Tax=Cordylochernes scorpioides TaxID=51811 RepID=A0ABY6KD16_9ARAC|nr:GTF2IRD2 [Cordylochernes scorpioides]
MHGTTTGEDIFNCVYDILQKYNLPQSKLTSVATDGAPSMTGKTNGFVALLRKKLSEISDGSNIHHTHCIIHQEVLCTKRQFSLFLTELESEYSGLSYYTEVRWLSCSKVLKQFWGLKEEICQFLITKNQDITLFSDQVWLQDFSFMVDITKHLSDLNLKLQGKDQIIANMCDQVNAFKCETASYQKYAEKMLSLRNEFETRFSDFKSLEGKFTLFSSIFPINIESVPNHMQMEVIDIQCDSDLKAKFIEVVVSEFYKYLPARFENTRKLAYEIMSMFGSTYRCEQLFSLMKGNKSPIRSRITDVHLGSRAKFFSLAEGSPDWKQDEEREMLRNMLMTACDLAASTKTWSVQQKVAELVTSEFFDQGDKEKSQLKIQPQLVNDIDGDAHGRFYSLSTMVRISNEFFNLQQEHPDHDNQQESVGPCAACATTTPGDIMCKLGVAGQVPWGKGIIGYVARTGEAVNLAQASSDPRYCDEVDRVTGYRTDSLLCLPLRNQETGEVFAVAQVVNKLNGEFTPDDEKVSGL